MGVALPSSHVMIRCILISTTLLALLVKTLEAVPVGCGGFVEASPQLTKLWKSPSKIDFSRITVELRNEAGAVRDSMQCFPNGYYFLPVYDKGTFFVTLKGPDGWSFEPTQEKVVVDAEACRSAPDKEEDGAKGREDLNFAITGFRVTGRVNGKRQGSCRGGEGPTGVDVALVRLDNEPKVVSTVLTKEGSYSFEGVLPGKYRVQASHPKWQIEGGPFEVDVGLDNVEAPGSFEVGGYDVTGRVLSQGEAVIGVNFYLFSDGDIPVPCPVTVPAGIQIPGHTNRLPACLAISNGDGKFELASLPCGKYVIVPLYRGESTVFDVSPKELAVDVGHGSVAIQKAFEVTGFSVGGRVVRGGGEGVAGAKVLLNGVHKATTNEQGYYTLDEVRTADYVVGASKEGYTFASVEKLRLVPSLKAIPDIAASAFQLCGQISVQDKRFALQRQITLTGTGVSAEVKNSDAAGRFCFTVPKGDYTILPFVGRDEAAAGLLFSPSQIDAKVDRPILGLEFTQAQVRVSGSVSCTSGPCDALVSVSIRSATNSNSPQVARTTQLAGNSGTFTFENVGPGKYTLEVKCAYAPEVAALGAGDCPKGADEAHEGCWAAGDAFCWEKARQEVEVRGEDLTGVRFEQRGFALRIHSSDPVATTAVSGGAVATLDVKRGWNEFCLPAEGEYTFRHVSACMKFGADEWTWSTKSPVALKWKANLFLVEGTLNVDAASFSDANSIGHRMVVDTVLSGPVPRNDRRLTKLEKAADSSSPVAVYGFSFWAELGAQLTFRPWHDGGLNPNLDGGADIDTAMEKELQKLSEVERPHDYVLFGESDTFPPRVRILFCPQEQQVSVTSPISQPKVPEFRGRPAKQIIGQIDPPIAGVKVTAIFTTDSVCAGAKAGAEAVSTLSRADGRYALSPLHDDAQYEVRAVKVGFQLIPTPGGTSFAAHQLAHVVVQIEQGAGAESDMPPVLVTISGSDRFMRNQATDPATSSLTFNELFPGSFFLRPTLKEYVFTPSAEAIEVRSGERVEVKFVAERVAYSVMGTVTLLSGKPMGGVVIEARPLQVGGAWGAGDGHVEETVSEVDGSFRLRGLLPNRSYSVGVGARAVAGDGAGAIERSSPKAVLVTVGDANVEGVNFMVFDQSGGRTLTGSVVGPDIANWQRHISVQISNAEGKVVRTLPLPSTRFFSVSGLARGRYSVRLRFALAEKTHAVTYAEPAAVDMETAMHAHAGAVEVRVEERHDRQEITSTPVLPLAIAMVLVIAYASLPSIQESVAHWKSASASSASVPAKDPAVLYSKMAPNPNGVGRRKSRTVTF